MGRVIEVIYEKGVFKPIQKVDLPEKSKGVVIVNMKTMGDVEEVLEEIEKVLKETTVDEDPLQVLLEMRKRPWD